MTIVPETNVKRGPSLPVQLGVLLALTLGMAGVGWLTGAYLNREIETPPAAAVEESEAEQPAPANIVDLAPITTNLAVPETVWVRLELSLVFDQPFEDQTLPDTIQQDILAYIRTVKLMQVQGASGYQHLKSDLLERAAIRSNGLVKDILIRTMLFE
ncbi:MAG TPA: flagellar basal body-associated FliL family protein [Rhizobiaceae bacterium]|nr:flagellar basal body-associated FliL family protein [Rhizobiaceae bacterium]